MVWIYELIQWSPSFCFNVKGNWENNKSSNCKELTNYLENFCRILAVIEMNAWVRNVSWTPPSPSETSVLHPCKVGHGNISISNFKGHSLHQSSFGFWSLSLDFSIFLRCLLWSLCIYLWEHLFLPRTWCWSCWSNSTRYAFSCAIGLHELAVFNMFI